MQGQVEVCGVRFKVRFRFGVGIALRVRVRFGDGRRV